MSLLTSDNVIVYSRLSSVSIVRERLETEVGKFVASSRTRVGEKIQEQALTMMRMCSRSPTEWKRRQFRELHKAVEDEGDADCGLVILGLSAYQ